MSSLMQHVSTAPVSLGLWQAQVDARAKSSRGEPLGLLAGAVGFGDALVVLMSSATAHVLRHGLVAPALDVLLSTALAIVLFVNCAHALQAYSKYLTGSFPLQFGRAAQAWAATVATLIIIGYLTKTSDQYSRVWAIVWFAGGLAGIAAVRGLSVAMLGSLRRAGRLARTVAIVDLVGTGGALARLLRRTDTGDIRLLGVFSDTPSARRKGCIDDLITLAKLFRIDDVVVTMPVQADEALKSTLRRLGTMPTNVRLCPVLPDIALSPSRPSDVLLGIPVLTVHRRPLCGWNLVLKRAEDIVLSSILIVVLAPLLAILALLVKMESPGPAIFRQKRLGFNNNVIVVWKFRSMTHAAAPETDVPQATRNDARVTRLGKILRRSSLDELPQLFNVLRGEMSLVGPRPHALAHNEQYAALIDDYLGRHKVQPGITGWAQVHGLRGETDTLDKMQRRVAYDLAYVDKWSIFLDLKIILLTAVTTLFDRNAY